MLSKTEILTAAEIRTTIARIVAIAFGGNEAYWSRLVGNVAALTRSADPHSNWIVRPRGTAEERELINRAAAVVREAYPFAAR